MQILRAFQIIKQDGMYKVTTVYNSIDENGKTVRNNARRTDYVINEEMVSNIKALDDFFTDMLNKE